MPASQPANFNLQEFTDVGQLLVGGRLYTYAYGTTGQKIAFTDPDGTVPHTYTPDGSGGQYIALNARGELPAPLYLGAGSYDIALKRADGSTVWTRKADGVDNAANAASAALAAAGGSTRVGFTQSGVGAVPRTVLDKMLELPSFADRGATGAGDATAAIQAALNIGYGQVGDEVYLISAPLKLPSMSAFAGNRAGAAFTGTTPNVKRAIKKITNTPAAIKNFQTNVTSNIDCIAYTDPAWIDGGVSYPQRTSIERQAFQGNPDSPNFAVLYIEQGSGYAVRDVQMSGTIHSIYAKDCWSSVFENIQTTGKIVWEVGGTSCTFTGVGTGAGPGSTGGWSLAGLKYSTFNSCWNDGTTDTGWRLVNCKGLTFNSCGAENASASTANSGTAFAFDGGNDIILNGFCVVPVKNQVITPYTVGSDNTITFNQGTASFGVAGVNCPDLFVWGNNSTIVFNNYTFLNGSKDNPVVQYANGVSASRVIVNYGANRKIYTSTGNGVAVVEAEVDAGTFVPALTFGGNAVGMTSSTRTGSWQKNGKVFTGSGQLQLTAKGTSTGVAQLSGWPALSGPKGDVLVNFSLVVGVVGGPIIGTINAGSNIATLASRGATGDASVTEAAFTNGTLLWFTFTCALA